MWSVAVVALLMLSAIMGYDANGTFPPFEAVMVEFTQKQMLPIGGVLVALSMLPLPKEMIMGNSGILVFAPLSFFMWLFANGLVGASNYILKVVAGFFEQVQRLIGVTGKEQERSTSKRWIASILFVSLLVATIIPFQIAFMIVFIIQFSICCSAPPKIAAESSPKAEDSATSSPTPEGLRKQEIRRAQNFHLLVLLIWLALPFAAPILVVWVRTLQTAGYTVPFDGDHSVIVVLPWLLLGEVTASGRCLERESLNWRKRVTYASFLLLALTALLFGARFPYMVFEMATVVVAWLVATRVRWR
ncbi:SubName: Full=Related to sphingosine-1-phosphate lyase {ECO:0000313/EMBL:CCA69348.1} [Serendipita indica DSM 11827]|nr:SubName: Full=Related to sphingosine-1-phosphate lyase {ECO:0000313/EMBL:CCA69348.1} [Serendipita indica DSM 11827]